MYQMLKSPKTHSIATEIWALSPSETLKPEPLCFFVFSIYDVSYSVVVCSLGCPI